MTRRSDNRTTRLPVPAGQIPDFTPVPSRTNRHDGWTEKRQRDFINALADLGSVEAACKAVNMSSVGAYRIRRLPEGESFRKAWLAALDLGVQRLEDVAMDRALNGIDVPVYSYGTLVGMRKSYNDRLLMFMLRNRAPERFAEGGPQALNAVGKMEHERLRKELRAEWEAERAAKNVSPAEVRASIDRKVEAIRADVERQRAAEWEQMSPETREAWKRFEELRDADFERLKYDAEMRRKHREGPRETVNVEPFDWRPKRPEPEPNPNWHALKDDGWE